MVLGHVVLEAEHAGGVYLFVRVEFRNDLGLGLMFGGGIEVPERQVFHEHRAAFDKRAVGVDHEAAAVEDEVVLTADLIQVDDRGVNLGGTTLGELETGVGLAFLIRRAVDGEQQVDVLGGQVGHRAAVLPDVLADGHANGGAVHVEGHGAVAGGEDAEFVEHAVVGQEVLVVASPDHALVQDHQSVARLGGLAVGAHGADHHEQIAEAVVVELGGEFVGLVPCGLAEGAAQGQILDGVSGEGHFRENNHLGVSCGGFTGVVEHRGGVGVKRADAGVDLGECEAKLCHRFLV